MAAILAPYVTSMRLGSGFNSFTQELCVDNAVSADDRTKPLSNGDTTATAQSEEVKKPIAQSVTYVTKIVEKVSDVTDSLDVNAAFSVKYDTISANGNGKFINTNKLKDSDISFMISCKVVNQSIVDHSLTKFNSIAGVQTADFTRVYGDTFISGFQEGGDFTALISIKVKDKTQRESIVADAKVQFSGEKLQLDGSGQINKQRDDLLTENESSISVSWNGGGQDLKKSTDDWTWETMRAAALKFPLLVAETPVRTHAILTKYTALKSFATLGAQFTPLTYEHAGVYTTALQDAYMDYKNIAKNLQLLAFDVANGVQALTAVDISGTKDMAASAVKASSPAQLQDMTNSAESNNATTTSAKSESDSVKSAEIVVHGANGAPTTEEASVEPVEAPKALDPLVISKPYPPTIFGVEAARMHCRFMMNRIVSEVNAVARHPEIASDELRPLPYMSPFLFQLLLPIGKPVAAK